MEQNLDGKKEIDNLITEMKIFYRAKNCHMQSKKRSDKLEKTKLGVSCF